MLLLRLRRSMASPANPVSPSLADANTELRRSGAWGKKKKGRESQASTEYTGRLTETVGGDWDGLRDDLGSDDGLTGYCRIAQLAMRLTALPSEVQLEHRHRFAYLPSLFLGRRVNSTQPGPRVCLSPPRFVKPMWLTRRTVTFNSARGFRERVPLFYNPPACLFQWPPMSRCSAIPLRALCLNCVSSRDLSIPGNC